jgi:hypothetical protein
MATARDWGLSLVQTDDFIEASQIFITSLVEFGETPEAMVEHQEVNTALWLTSLLLIAGSKVRYLSPLAALLVSLLSRLGLQYVITTVGGVPGGLVESVALTSWVMPQDAVAWAANVQLLHQYVTRMLEVLTPLAEERRGREAAPQGGGGGAGQPDPAFQAFGNMRGGDFGGGLGGTGGPGGPGGDFGGLGGFAGYGQPPVFPLADGLQPPLGPQGNQLPLQALPPTGKTNISSCNEWGCA